MWSGRAASLAANVENRGAALRRDRDTSGRIFRAAPTAAPRSEAPGRSVAVTSGSPCAKISTSPAQLRTQPCTPQRCASAIDKRTKADALDAAAEQPFSRDAGDAELSTRGAHAAWANSRGARTPLAHQIRQAPSSDTMHGPMGVRGVQARP